MMINKYTGYYSKLFFCCPLYNGVSHIDTKIKAVDRKKKKKECETRLQRWVLI